MRVEEREKEEERRAKVSVNNGQYKPGPKMCLNKTAFRLCFLLCLQLQNSCTSLCYGLMQVDRINSL